MNQSIDSIMFFNRFQVRELIFNIKQYCKYIVKLPNGILNEKKLVFISSDKIKTYSFGVKSQIFVLILFLWVGNLIFSYVFHDHILKNKNNEIANLKETNLKFKKEVGYINRNLKRIHKYFKSISIYDHMNSKDDKINVKNLESKVMSKIFGDTKMTDIDFKTALSIVNSNIELNLIKKHSRRRISNLEKIISSTGLNLNRNIMTFDNRFYGNEEYQLSLNDTDNTFQSQGGPFKNIINNKRSKFTSLISNVNHDNNNLSDEITYLNNLEALINYLPLSKPMKNYYVSSGYGERRDPIKKTIAYHYGIDFVGGSRREEVTSASDGIVKKSGILGEYGKYVIIDHGYGITTHYAHLSQINVKKGDIVNRGDVIALQGSSGRSTGFHLHYEIRHNREPLNPRIFLKIGQEIF